MWRCERVWVCSMHGRYDGEMQPLRTTPRSHLWWGFIRLSRRLQLPAGWGLQTSLLHAVGWVSPSKKTKNYVEYLWTKYAQTDHSVLHWLLTLFLLNEDHFDSVDQMNGNGTLRQCVGVAGVKQGALWFTCRWFCWGQKNWSHAISWGRLWAESVCRWKIITGRNQVIRSFARMEWLAAKKIK